MSEENKDPGIPKARILKSQIQKSQPPGSKIPKTKIKICGLSRMEDIEAVNEACPDYCGFIINYPPSKRNISVDQLAELKKILRKEMKAVGVIVLWALCQKLGCAGFAACKMLKWKRYFLQNIRRRMRYTQHILLVIFMLSIPRVSLPVAPHQRHVAMLESPFQQFNLPQLQ